MSDSVLRLIGLATIALVMILALAAGAMRWIGQQREAEIPLPESDGCWLSICFFDSTTPEDLLAVLRVEPQIVDGSVMLNSDLQSGGNYLIELQFTRGGSRYWPVLLYWLPHTTDLVYDWRDSDNPRLWQLGDVIRAYGEPQMISFLANEVMLHYPNRHLQVIFDPAARDGNWARITPEDAVFSVTMISSEIAGGETTQIFYPPASAWEGFGVYRFEG